MISFRNPNLTQYITISFHNRNQNGDTHTTINFTIKTLKDEHWHCYKYYISQSLATQT